MPHRRPRCRTALAIAIALLTAACSAGGKGTAVGGTTTTPDSGDYCRGTSFGSQVVVYSAKGLEYWYNDVLTEFQANCGVHVLFLSAPSRQIEQRLDAEKASPLADVIIAEDADLSTADAEGLLQTDGAPGSSAVPDARCGPGRHWCDVLENFVSLVYNPLVVKDPPHTFADLLSPRFSHRLLLSNLDQADDGRSLLEFLDEVLGRNAALQYITRLEPSVVSHWITTDTMSRIVAAGYALAANGNLHEDLNDIVQYHNIAIWFPLVGSTPTTMAAPYGAALVRGGHNHSDAVALLKFIWSKEGQSAVADASALPARTDMSPDDCRSRNLLKRLSGVRILRPDWQKIARDEQYLDRAWLRLKRAPDGVPPPPKALPALQPC